MLLSQESKTTNMQKVNLISPTIKHILQIGANLLFALILCCFFVPAAYCQKIKVSHLTTELIEETDIVYSNGFPTDKAISEYCTYQHTSPPLLVANRKQQKKNQAVEIQDFSCDIT